MLRGSGQGVALGAALAAASLCPAAARAEVERPPQFVAMAFDNCTELDRWQELTDFADGMNRDGDRLHFTFFVSGTNFITDASRASYQGPGQPRGTSRINFGGSANDVTRRVAYANDLSRRGHEIASHAVGHFNGGSWSAADWAHEFRSFEGIVRKVGAFNNLGDTVKLDIPPVVGFRAPYLAASAGLNPVLRESGFRYDTSRVGHADAWPEKIDGVWRFNLAMLRIRGSNKPTLSMDYNFFVAQANATSDPARQALHRDQVLQTYLEYFRANYTGNRAPLHIGHHFFDYQGGAYKEALKSFARLVCGMPEVRCVTYAKLADFMDGQQPETLAAFRKGEFSRDNAPVRQDFGALGPTPPKL